MVGDGNGKYNQKMKKFLTYLSMVVCMLALSNSANASAIVGAGTQTCTQWLAARLPKAPEAMKIMLIENWIQGFLSGSNAVHKVVSGKFRTLPDGHTIAPTIDEYCLANPNHDMFQTGMDMFAKTPVGQQ